MRRRLALTAIGLLALVLAAVGLAAWGIGRGGFAGRQSAGEITPARLPESFVREQSLRRGRAERALARAGDGASDTQILFGDLHVHTTFSNDAFFFSLPLMQGEGAHPPADACDFARFCSALDFWSINDHAELITPAQWSQTRRSIRECNAVAGDPANPDVVAFLGWEWTQMGLTPRDHYGHKNVILLETAEDAVPARPIAARRGELSRIVLDLPVYARVLLGLVEYPQIGRYIAFNRYAAEAAGTPICPEGVDVHELPSDCMEYAPTPDLLFEKLDQWGGESLVIPHGLSWGIHAPPNADLAFQLTRGRHDPRRQRLLEVYSGHGSSERWAAFEHVRPSEGGGECPEPRDGFTPCCWRAGEIIRERCADAPEAVCERRVAEARRSFARMGRDLRRFEVVQGSEPGDWLDCGQHPGFLPASDYRPRASAQYALARRQFDAASGEQAFRFGLIGSGDNHYARPGTGYKEFSRRGMSDSRGVRSDLRARFAREPPEPRAEPLSLDQLQALSPLAGLAHMERGNSFLYTGGLAAVHARSRSRDGIWRALQRRETYATSGERILLWFDLLEGDGVRHPMGAEVDLDGTPRFRVRAVGALEQRPGCPSHSLESLSPERLERLCKGECYHPGETRRRITRIEVVRIRPQIRPDEPIAPLIEDPWASFVCPPDPAGCRIEFEDPDFVAGGRETIYYVRAIQEPSPAVNGGNLRCERDSEGRCVRTRPCYASGPREARDDCLGPVEERAWSSPIFVR